MRFLSNADAEPRHRHQHWHRFCHQQQFLFSLASALAWSSSDPANRSGNFQITPQTDHEQSIKYYTQKKYIFSNFVRISPHFLPAFSSFEARKYIPSILQCLSGRQHSFLASFVKNLSAKTLISCIPEIYKTANSTFSEKNESFSQHSISAKSQSIFKKYERFEIVFQFPIICEVAELSSSYC